MASLDNFVSTLEKAHQPQEHGKIQATGAVDDAWSKHAGLPKLSSLTAIADGDTIPSIYDSVSQRASAVVKDPGTFMDLAKEGAVSAAKFVMEECQQHPQAASFVVGVGVGLAAAALHMKIRPRIRPTSPNLGDDHAIADGLLTVPKLEPGFDGVRKVNVDAFTAKLPIKTESAAVTLAQSGEELSIKAPGLAGSDAVGVAQNSSLSAALDRLPDVSQANAQPAALSSRLNHIDRGRQMPKALNLDEIMKHQADLRAAGQSTGVSPSPWLKFDQAVEAVQGLTK